MPATRVECDCGATFKARFNVDDDEDIQCPACRSDDRDRDKNPETLECGVCGEEHLGLTRRERRSMTGRSFDATVCIIESGEVLLHPDDEAELDQDGDSS